MFFVKVLDEDKRYTILLAIVIYNKRKKLFFFFFIDNVKILLKKSVKPSTLGMYYGGTNQEPKLQRSSKTGREEQEKWEKTTLQSKRMCKKKDLNSRKESSQPSKLLAFLSCQMHHIKQWGSILQTFMLQCHPNFACQDSKNSITVWGIT